MDWNWQVFFCVAIVNTTLCLMQFLFQTVDKRRRKISPRHSLIPGTKQKFLYWEDFYTQTYGDFLGLVWVMNGFAHLLINEKIDGPLWIIFIFVLFICSMVVTAVCLASDHKPDWGFPKIGMISLGGASHIPYFSLNAAMIIICLFHAVIGTLSGMLLITTATGVAILMMTAIADVQAGHFDPLNKEEKAEKL
ncbi:MAG: hypothetical protein WCT50_00295 [Patescibacteria group bacterium]|jgi:uncharacterized membrane protein